MYILGINGGFGGGYQDACACLYKDGSIIAAVEEERLNKIKFSTGLFPFRAIQEVMNLGNVTISDIDVLAFHGKTWQGKIEEDIRIFFNHHFGQCPSIKRYHHHDAHAASTYFLSGFEEALVVTMDNSGDGISSQLMLGKNGKLELLKNWQRPDSFGTFYSCITQLAGFNRDADEYKLMGLAPYGNPTAYDLEFLLSNDEDGNYFLNTDYIYPILPGQSFPNKQIPLYTNELLNKLNIPQSHSIRNTTVQKDLAASAQYQLEKVVCKWLEFWIKKTEIKNICLAGGVAMNCVLNQQITKRCNIESIFIPPFSGDQGISMGNAFLAGVENGNSPEIESFTPYTGRSFSIIDTESILKENKISYTKIENSTQKAAELLAKGSIIGWMQNEAEIGARALGNRSILANPAIKGMKEKINATIKHREHFRPFCPSVLEEDFSVYFSSTQTRIPYMNITVDCKEITQKKLPEIVHANQTARVQTVSSKDNEQFHLLLLELKKQTGHGVVLNTSLNVRNQPMAYDVNDALITFFTSGLDALFIGNILLEK
jgi:carbamoyltransferase